MLQTKNPFSAADNRKLSLLIVGSIFFKNDWMSTFYLLHIVLLSNCGYIMKSNFFILFLLAPSSPASNNGVFFYKTRAVMKLTLLLIWGCVTIGSPVIIESLLVWNKNKNTIVSLFYVNFVSFLEKRRLLLGSVFPVRCQTSF